MLAVHFAMAASDEHAVSVQEAERAVEGMHSVARVQEGVEGSQQPWAPKYVFVAQVCVEFGQVIGLAGQGQYIVV